jgi:hypothetical protein
MIYTKTGSGAGPISSLIALGRSTSRYINVYSSRKNILLPSLLSAQPTDSGSTAHDAAWSDGGNYLVVATGDSPAGTKFFSRSGLTLTAQTVPSNFNNADGSCAISENGEYVAAAGGGNGRIWHNSSGTLTNLTSVGSFTSGTRVCGANSDGSYIAFLGSSSPNFLRIKVRSGSGATATYSDMSLASQPTSGTSAGTTNGGLAFSPDGVYLAVSPVNQAHQTIYKFNAGTSIYEQLASPFAGSLPDDFVYGCAFSAQGDFLAIATLNKTFFYERVGDTFTNVANVTASTPSAGLRGNFHPSGNFYITGSGRIYRKNSASSWTAVGSQLQSFGRCAAFSPSIL